VNSCLLLLILPPRCDLDHDRYRTTLTKRNSAVNVQEEYRRPRKTQAILLSAPSNSSRALDELTPNIFSCGVQHSTHQDFSDIWRKEQQSELHYHEREAKGCTGVRDEIPL
jgi:hypothetical protein